MRISTPTLSPFETKEVSLTCERCGVFAYVERDGINDRADMRAAMLEHQRVMHSGGRVRARIDYPRA